MKVTSFLQCQSWCEQGKRRKNSLLSPQPLRLLLLGVSSPRSRGGGHIQWLREAGAWKPGYFTQCGGTLRGQPCKPCRRQCSLGGWVDTFQTCIPVFPSLPLHPPPPPQTFISKEVPAHQNSSQHLLPETPTCHSSSRHGPRK